MKVIIAGGGIGGLTTALMLHARGIDCEVFEQAEQVRELGVGINTLPHAIKELAGLGFCRGSMRSPSAPMSCSIPIASARRFGASRAASMPATTCRNFRFIAAACKA